MYKLSFCLKFKKPRNLRVIFCHIGFKRVYLKISEPLLIKRIYKAGVSPFFAARTNAGKSKFFCGGAPMGALSKKKHRGTLHWLLCVRRSRKNGETPA
jgi:hypothetical protein